MNTIITAKHAKEIGECFVTFKELRPQLVDQATFIRQILHQQNQGYILIYIKEGDEVAACLGYRIFDNLVWGKVLYIDDMICREKSRKRGLGTQLIDFTIKQAKSAGCKQIHLDTGYLRHEAHRFYFNLGFTIDCHHFMLDVSKYKHLDKIMQEFDKEELIEQIKKLELENRELREKLKKEVKDKK